MDFRDSRWIEAAEIIFYIIFALLVLAVFVVSIVFSSERIPISEYSNEVEIKFLFGRFLLLLLAGASVASIYFLFGMIALNFLYNVSELKSDVNEIKSNLKDTNNFKKTKQQLDEIIIKDTVKNVNIPEKPKQQSSEYKAKKENNKSDLSWWFCEKCGTENGPKTTKCVNCFSQKPN